MMKPIFQNNFTTLYNGDVLAVLPELPSESVDCVVTSPPYYGLRDYGVDGQIGLEPTPQEYIENLVRVFREIRRVMRDSGVVFLNLGDSYNSGGRFSPDAPTSKTSKSGKYGNLGALKTAPTPKVEGLKHKDLIGIPWMVAFALRADGWYLRSDIIWNKPNPMPESVTDRPTKAHEYVFLLSKSERYFYNAEAIREPLATWEMRDGQMVNTKGGQGYAVTRRPEIYPGNPKLTGNMAAGKHITPNPAGRNARSVWTIATEPYRGAHFAVMPSELVKRCILAGCPAGGVVMDCFAGSGTVLEVAQNLGNRSVGIELNPTYCELIKSRFKQSAFDFESAYHTDGLANTRVEVVGAD